MSLADKIKCKILDLEIEKLTILKKMLIEPFSFESFGYHKRFKIIDQILEGLLLELERRHGYGN